MNVNDYLSLCHYEQPYIEPKIYQQFLSEKDCDIIISLAQSNFSDSQIGQFKIDNQRHSKTSWLNIDDHIIILKLYQKISNLLKININSFEKLQVVYYEENDYFQQHYDQQIYGFEKDLIRFKGPRLCTVLIYLNHPYEYLGGETFFPNLNQSFKGKKGDAILFYNLDITKFYVHPKSLHEAKPLQKGKKYICNIWIRDQIL
jgi:prolyl 4-hydroxylase